MPHIDPVLLTAELCNRREELKLVFGEESYRKHTGYAKPLIARDMELNKDDSPISAALRVCKTLKEEFPDADVSTSQQFVLAAAADMVDEQKAA